MATVEISLADRLIGRRVQIAGSISGLTPADRVRYAHEVVRALVRGILRAGGGLVLGVGKEPRAPEAPADAPGLTFYWSALETAAECFERGEHRWPEIAGPPVVVVLSEKAHREIPPPRRPLWDILVGRQLVRAEWIFPGARSGALLRQRQADFGDCLVVLGGGTGVEHLADMYLGRRRSVVPLDAALGASREDGLGGAERLAVQARANPGQFLILPRASTVNAGSLLTDLATLDCAVPAEGIAARTMTLLQHLALPTAFHVRLLNADHSAFGRVEHFFRFVVDPVVEAHRLERVEMGHDPSHHGLMNVELFETVHFASVVIVDVTGSRPNCFIELGYALARRAKVLVTAEKGTDVPWDQHALPCHFWTDGEDNDARIREFEAFWHVNIDRPPIILGPW